MKTLGIIGGTSPESTATYYTEINHLVNKKLGGNHSAPLAIISVEFEELVQIMKAGDWHELGCRLATEGKKLEQIGADAVLLATNTMHKVAPQIVEGVSVPFLSVIDATANAIKAKGLRRVALLGTQFTMSDNFYRDGLSEQGITPLVPSDAVQAEMNRIIFEELCTGKLLPESKQYYLNAIEELKVQGAQGVILGCTEIGLLLQQQDSDLIFFDTALLHAQMAADFILEN